MEQEENTQARQRDRGTAAPQDTNLGGVWLVGLSNIGGSGVDGLHLVVDGLVQHLQEANIWFN